MPTKRTVVLNGHPAPNSLSQQFAATYAETLQASGAEVRQFNLSELDFDPDFGQGNYSKFKPLEPDLEELLQALEWCDHLVIATPMWWGGPPALLKGLFDRMLVPGRTFNTKVLKMGMPTPMLGGRTAQVILTSDTPMWAFRLLYGRAMIKNIHRQILKFVGFAPKRPLYFSGASEADKPKVDGWIAAVRSSALREV